MQEDDENFKRCVDFTMYHILCEKHSIPSQMFTSEKLDTFATRYDYEDFSYYAENLKSAVETYLNLDSTITENKVRNIAFCIIYFKIQLCLKYISL